MTSMSGLEGTVIAITGGASGIGRQVALSAAADGVRVAILDRNFEQARALESELGGAGRWALAVEVDVTDQQALDVAMGTVETALGPIFGTVTAAGLADPCPTLDMSHERWNRMISINLSGTFFACQAAGRRMVQHGRGAIVTLASINGLGGQVGRTHYCATKFGVIGMTKALALEWGSKGVRVNCVAPGPVDTPLLHVGVPDEVIDNVYIDRTPQGHLASAVDQANAILFLMSAASASITGITLPVDGGLTAGYITRKSGTDYMSKALLAKGAAT